MAIEKNLYIDQGSNYSISLTAYDSSGTPLNISGSTGTCYFKRSYFYTTSYVEGIITPTSNYNFTLSIGSTAFSDVKTGYWVYDIKFEFPNNSYMRIYEGKALISPKVT